MLPRYPGNGSDGREVAGGGEGLIAGGGPVFPGAGWAYVTVME